MKLGSKNILKAKSIKNLIVRSRPGENPSAGLLNFDGQVIHCCLGKNGITTRKQEGDGSTPTGSYRLLFGWHRKERTGTLITQLPFRTISENDGWCDEPNSPVYNKPVSLPFVASHEVMKRKDRLYDICIVMDHNIHPRARGVGSAIFFHLTSPDHRGTEGCIAIDPGDMMRLLPALSGKTVIHILK